MTLQPPRQILELYGTTGPILRRPRLVAAACWILAFACLTATLVGAFWLIRTFLLPPGAVDRATVLWIYLASSAVIVSGNLVAITAICIADLARGHVNPWPKRLMTAGVLFACGLAAAYRAAEIYEYLSAPPLSIDYYIHVYVPLQSAEILTDIVTNIFSLCYVLQIAHWLNNSTLRWTTALLFLYGLAVTTTHLVLEGATYVMIAFRYHGFIPSLTFVGFRVLGVGQMILAVLVGIYYAVIATRLGKAARMQ